LKGHLIQPIEEIQEKSITELGAIAERFRKHSNRGRNVGNGVSPVEGTTFKGTVLTVV
jgi:hypothetical protein